MSLIRFDPSGALNPDFGAAPDEFSSLSTTLESLRDAVVREGQVDAFHPASPHDGQVNGASFFSMPERQLLAYDQHREASELGRIFTLANGLHDELDAIVVLGNGGSSLGPRAMMKACCDPYHNERSRAARGSKPRMYFEGSQLDNDTSAALLERLAAGGYGDTSAEKFWGIVPISKSGETLETNIAVRQFLAALASSLGESHTAKLRRFVVPILGTTVAAERWLRALGCDETFHVPSDLSGRYSILSPVGLFPAALLGLDCMKLLEGAVAINDHFKSTPFRDNLVLQYVAVNHLLAKHQGKSIRVMCVGSEALEAVGHWYDHLVSGSLGHSNLGPTPITIVHSRDLHSRLDQHCRGAGDHVFHHLRVDSWRHDPLRVGHRDNDQDRYNSIASKTVPELNSTSLRSGIELLRERGRPTTEMVLPHIDTYYLGQLFQMLMIATVLEGRLLGCDPYAQPDVADYKRRLVETLIPNN